MLKKLNLHEWIQSIQSCSLSFIPHLSICLIYFLYLLIGASLLQEIESDGLANQTSSLTRLKFQQEREDLIVKLIQKRDTLDLEQYTKHVYKHIRQYEEDVRKRVTFEEYSSSFNFSRTFLFLTTTITTLGSNEYFPRSRLGKCFLMIYTSLGIPLTLIFIIDLSYLIQQLIESILFSYLSLFISKSIRFVLRKDVSQSNLTINLNLLEIILVLLLYLYIGSYFFPSKIFVESFYRCFLNIFTIQSPRKFSFGYAIYMFIGLALAFLYIKTIQNKIENFLIHFGKNLHQNLVELTHQMGLYKFNSEDLPSKSPSPRARQSISRAISLDQSSTLRPIGIAEPLRRLSTGFILAFKPSETVESKSSDKSVQVCTIIRRCGRCAETSLPVRPLRKHSAISLSSSAGEASSFEDDDVMDYPPPSFDRIRQRRATQVAKTIINQLATQPRSSSIENLIPSMTFGKALASSPRPIRYSVKVSQSPKRDSQVEFEELSKQISTLLVPSDDENVFN